MKPVRKLLQPLLLRSGKVYMPEQPVSVLPQASVLPEQVPVPVSVLLREPVLLQVQERVPVLPQASVLPEQVLLQVLQLQASEPVLLLRKEPLPPVSR